MAKPRLTSAEKIAQLERKLSQIKDESVTPDGSAPKEKQVRQTKTKRTDTPVYERPPLIPVPVLIWQDCYDDGWRGLITEESFAHPAKIARGLIRKIYDHLFEIGALRRKSVVVDPFGGIGTTAIEGAWRDIQVYVCELEPKFAALAAENFELHRRGLEEMGYPLPGVANGDSRKLRQHISSIASAVIASPPYSNKQVGTGRSGGKQDDKVLGSMMDGYGGSDGQLGEMRDESVDAVVSSPPYAESLSPDRGGNRHKPGFSQGTTGGEHLTGSGYGDSVGQLERLAAGEIDAVVSSPPYNLPMSQDHNGARGGTRGSTPSEDGAFAKYGVTEGQIDGLPMGDIDVVVSSPPYVAPPGHDTGHPRLDAVEDARRATEGSARRSGYGDADGNIAAMPEGQIDALISSPPYAAMQSDARGSGIDIAKNYETYRRSGGGASLDKFSATMKKHSQGYGESAGQLGSMAEGDVDVVISSPPYAESLSPDREGQIDALISSPPFESTGVGGSNNLTNRNRQVVSKNRPISVSQEMGRSLSYGNTSGQLADMESGNVDCIVSSPPYAEIATGAGGLNTKPAKEGQQGGRSAASASQDTDQRYGESEGQLSRMEKGDVDCVISSPPYADLPTKVTGENPEEKIARLHSEGRHADAEKVRQHMSGPAGNLRQEGYGETDGQLSAMEKGAVDAVVSSPPYISGGHHTDVMASWNVGTRPDGRPGGHGIKKETAGYGATDGQMGTLNEGSIDAVISSPPYADTSLNDDQRNAQQGNPLRGGSDKEYGTTDGQLAVLPPDTVDGVISSPPYEGSTGVVPCDHAGDPGWGDAGNDISKRRGQTADYGDTEGQIGHTTGETFWSAARDIVRESYEILKPGGVAVWIVKAFVRDRQIVDFPNDWRRLCEYCGFETLTEVHAMLVKQNVEYDLWGNEIVEVTERKSFFRRLAEKKGSPKIDYEVVWVMRKPL